jgi:glycine cleavage system H protein
MTEEQFPQDLRYTTSDEWVRVDGDELVCGITAYASEQLGDVVYLQLPESGTHYEKGDAYGEIESVKAVSDLNAPLGCTVLAVNTDLETTPSLVNDDPYGRGWISRLTPDSMDDLDTLLDAAAYQRETEERA